MLKCIGLNEEKEICLPNEEKIGGIDRENLNMIAKCIVQV